MIRASFAVPGDLGAPTGGYGYARRLLAEAGGAGVELAHLALPGGFPDPSPAELGQAGRLLGTLPAGRPILIDGLALGVLPADLLRALPVSLVGSTDGLGDPRQAVTSFLDLMLEEGEGTDATGWRCLWRVTARSAPARR
ncbi:MAG: hypothetical protein IID49_13830 [Proteobacteria bacterium]|nr:hypothetical protein [Pseudomonadota bacterium]